MSEVAASLKVLLVDPDAGRRLSATLQLRALGHTVEAVAVLSARSTSSRTVDLLIAGGDQLASTCRLAIDEGVAPLIFALVDLVDLGAVEDALAAGASDCLAYPIVRSQLELRLAVARARAAGSQPGPIASEADARAALRASEASLRSVLQASPEGVIVHRGGRFLYVNPAGVELLGFASAEAAREASIYDTLAPQDVPWVRERVTEMMTTGTGARPRDLEFVRADGGTFVGEAASITASFAGARAIITIIRDVGDQRKIQNQAFLADRLATVGTLTVGVAHEINNPLAWVVGNLGLLGDEFDNQVRMRELPVHDPVAVAASRARVRELLGRAQEGTQRVHRIVRDLGRFGRADQGEDEVVDLHALLDSAIEIADVQIRHRARLARELRARRFVQGSEARLGQVFLNLLVNAGQAIAPGSSRDNTVRVSTRDLDDGRVEVAISDTGVGIAAPVLRRIFEPFFTTKPAGEGTGIGLAISHDIVTAMGGEIVVESEVGRGTTFRVRLRGVADADAPVPVGPSPSASHHGGEQDSASVRVLVVDDEPLIREMVCDALSKYEVTAVDNGRDALTHILAQDWDLILCDVILPELSGLDLYSRIQRDRPELVDKLVFMTGGDFSSSSSHGMRTPVGSVRRLDKPFSIKALRALVASAGTR